MFLHNAFVVLAAASSAVLAAPSGSQQMSSAAKRDPSYVFDGQCSELTLGGSGKKGQTTLEARCSDGSGNFWYTKLNINQCLGNDAGRLVYEDMGNFDDTCRPCILGQNDNGDEVLKCNCLPKPNGVPKYTDIVLGLTANDLSPHPVEGRLVCGSHEGTKTTTKA